MTLEQTAMLLPLRFWGALKCCYMYFTRYLNVEVAGGSRGEPLIYMCRGNFDGPRRHGHATLRIPSCRGEFSVQDTRDTHTQMPIQREKMRPAKATFFLTAKATRSQRHMKERQRTSQNAKNRSRKRTTAPGTRAASSIALLNATACESRARKHKWSAQAP